jgi:hypothetical protein
MTIDSGSMALLSVARNSMNTLLPIVRALGSLTFAGLIAFACSSGSGGSSAACPSGSYSATCSGAACTASTISASCREQDGVTFSETTLPLPCESSIANCNGELTCGQCRLPSGTYTQSCAGCAASSTLLTCLSCANLKHVGEESSVALPCAAGVENCNGQLVCGTTC